MDTPRDIAKRHRPGRPVEDELEDDIARHVIAKDKRIAELEAALVALIDAVDAKDESIDGALFVGRGLTFQNGSI